MNFIYYGKPKTTQAAPKAEIKEEKQEEAVVVMAESTKTVLEEEKIDLEPATTVEEVVEKVKKSKKLHAQVSEGGKKVRVKRVLKD